MSSAPNIDGEDGDEKCLVAWSIAGSDSGGGAGVQSDVRTFQDFGVHPASVVTCITAQNTVALTESHVLSAAVVRAQIEALRADLAPDAIKIGALGSAENAAAVLDFLHALAPAERPFVVWDPVQTATVGGDLGSLPGRTVAALLAVTDVVTPNAEELVALTDGSSDLVAGCSQSAKPWCRRRARHRWPRRHSRHGFLGLVGRGVLPRRRPASEPRCPRWRLCARERLGRGTSVRGRHRVRAGTRPHVCAARAARIGARTRGTGCWPAAASAPWLAKQRC